MKRRGSLQKVRDLLQQFGRGGTGTGQPRTTSTKISTKMSEMGLMTACDFSDDLSNAASDDDAVTQVQDELEQPMMESRIQLNRIAYIAGDTITGALNIKSTKPRDLIAVDIKLIGKGTTQYFKAKLRAQKLCEVIVPTSSVKESCVEAKKEWNIPIVIKLEDDYPSTVDGGKKGRVIYFISWNVQLGDHSYKDYCEVTILANHSLDGMPPTKEMCGNNRQEEEYDLMQLEIYSPASAYLPGEMIQFQTTVRNLAKKPVKKIAVLLLQNVLFWKSAQCSTKGRSRSFLMTVKEKSLNLKTDEVDQWRDEIQLPDPIPPSADVFHKIDYELVLVAITKGRKSSMRALFDEARYHFDLGNYQDNYFRDFLPHACCYFSVGSHHRDHRSPSLNGAAAILPINEQWKLSTKEKKERRKLPKVSSQAKIQQIQPAPLVARITFRP